MLHAFNKMHKVHASEESRRAKPKQAAAPQPEGAVQVPPTTTETQSGARVLRNRGQIQKPKYFADEVTQYYGDWVPIDDYES